MGLVCSHTRSRTERERARKAKEAGAEAAAAKAAAAPVKAVKLADISKWKPFGLDKRLERGLAELGFSAPTKIQEECLPSAVLHGHVRSCVCLSARPSGAGGRVMYV